MLQECVAFLISQRFVLFGFCELGFVLASDTPRSCYSCSAAFFLFLVFDFTGSSFLGYPTKVGLKGFGFQWRLTDLTAGVLIN